MLNYITQAFHSIFTPRDYDRTLKAPRPLPQGVDASYVNPADGREIKARMAKGVANVSVVSAIQMRIIAQAVGRGMMPSFAGSGDPVFDAHITELIRDWSDNPEYFDVGGRLSLTDYQRLAVSAQLLTGELFSIHRKGGFYGYQVQAINSESVIGGKAAFDKATVEVFAAYDGIGLDEDGKAVAYALSNGKVLSSDVVHHLFDPSREANCYRGLPFAYTSVNKAIHLHELEADATGSAKGQARFAWFRTGRKNTTVKSKDSAGNVLTSSSANSADSTQLAGDLSNILGGGGSILDLGDGEDMKPVSASSPTDRTLAMLVVLAENVCLSYGFAPDLILRPGSIGSTGIRAILSQAEKTIYQLQAPVSRMTKVFCVRFVAAAMQPINNEDGSVLSEFGFIGKPLPLGWERMIKIQYPSTLSVDYGRDTAANLKLLAAGQITERDLQEAEGRSWEEIQDQRIKEVKRSLEKCKEAGIPFELYRSPQAGAAAPSTDQPNTDGSNNSNG